MFRGIFREILYIYRITLKLSIMALTEKMELRTVTGITQADFNAIYYFLQGAIYCWCKAKREEWFTVQDLLGGENFYWEGTPLIALYRKHKDTLGKDWETAVQDAGKDAGKILKRVIHDDRRVFDSKKEDVVRMYKWNAEASE